jgi:hypothetical protein
MGWASASGIFDSVAEAVIEAGVETEKGTKVLKDLIETLSYDDWDTQDESIEGFRKVPMVLEAFRQAGFEHYVDEYAGTDE